MIDFQRILDRVPDYPNFLSVAQMDESTLRLQQEYPIWWRFASSVILDKIIRFIA